MTKKDYIAVAKIIELVMVSTDTTPEGVQRFIAQEMALMFARDNSRFDRERFMKACGLWNATADIAEMDRRIANEE